MADQPTSAPTAAPAPAPVAASQPAPAPAAIPDDTLIPVIVDRQTRQEPLSVLRSSFQTQTAAENRLKENNRLLQESKADIEFSRRFKAKLATDPEGALAEVQKFAEQHHGRRVRLPGPAREDGDAGLPAGDEPTHNAHTAALERRFAELAAKLDGLSTVQQIETTDRQIDAALSQYPMWNGSTPEAKAARELARLTIAGLHSASPDVAVADHASEVHSRMAAMLTTQVNQVRDARLDRAAAMPTAPTQGGTPPMTTPDPEGWGTRRALRDGTFQRRLGEFMAGFNRPR